jgi:hypothetical protein
MTQYDLRKIIAEELDRILLDGTNLIGAVIDGYLVGLRPIREAR